MAEEMEMYCDLCQYEVWPTSKEYEVTGIKPRFGDAVISSGMRI